MNAKKKVILLVLFLLSLGFTTMVHAEDSEFKVSVEPLLPKNQITQDVKYFDLRMKPSEEQKITMRLTNHTSEQVVLKVVYSPAKTTSQGVIEYSENKDLIIDSPSEYLFNHIIKGPKNITLKSKEIKDIEFILQMPDKEFDGFIAGGVEFIQEVETAEDSSALKTQRSYLVGFKLSETDKKLPIDLELNQTVVGTKNYKNAIIINLANQNANYVEDLTIQAIVSKKEESTILLETNMEQVRIAPYSVLETPIYLDKNLLDPGDYQIKLTTKDKNKFKKEWTQEFKVTKKDAELFKENQKLWEDAPQSKGLWLLILVASISIIGIIIWFKKEALLKKKKVKGTKHVKK